VNLHGKGKYGQAYRKNDFRLCFLYGGAGGCPLSAAGSFRYWQACVYLVVFALCTILITAYLVRTDRALLAGRVQAGPVAETQKSQQIIQSLAGLFFLGLFIVPGLDFHFGWSNMPPVISLAADGIVALGFYFVFQEFTVQYRSFINL
jgi:hypothetical protein